MGKRCYQAPTNDFFVTAPFLSGLGYYFVWNERSIDQLRVSLLCAMRGLGKKGAGGLRWEDGRGHLNIWALCGPVPQHLCTKVELQGQSSLAGAFQVYDLLLALLWGHLHFPERGSGACHTTPAGDQRLEASKDVGSQGTVHKMTSRISYPGCMGGGVRWQSGTFPGKQLSNGWALHKCWAAGREPVPHLPGASNLLCGVILHRYLPDGAAH